MAPSKDPLVQFAERAARIQQLGLDTSRAPTDVLDRMVALVEWAMSGYGESNPKAVFVLDELSMPEEAAKEIVRKLFHAKL